MITILNTDTERRKIHALLNDCIRAQTGGSWSPWLREATKVSGWDHVFCGWKDCKSIESLEIVDQDTLERLEKIYDLSIDEIKNMT